MSRDLYIKARLGFAEIYAMAFKDSVLADGGTFEAESCLVEQIKELL